MDKNTKSPCVIVRSIGASNIQLLMIVAILALYGIQAFTRPGSVSFSQSMNVARQASALGIVVLGQALVILAGGIDLSVGSMITLTNVFAVSIMNGQDRNFLLAVLVCLGMGLLCGTVNAIGVLKLNIAPFVMTLCSMSIMQGIYLVYTGGSPSGNVAPMLKSLGNGYLFGVIPYAVAAWLLLALLVWWAITRTPFGRWIYAVGSNAEAARLCGISVKGVRFSAYVMSSLLAVVAGLLVSGYIGTTSLSLGNDYIVNSLAAVLIGGNAIEGGKGGVWGPVLGSFFIMMLFAVLTMMNIGQEGKLIIQGSIIFSVVALQNMLKKRGR